jgi:putative zinc finger/helix-turn-helix YgiT family protein
MISRASSHDCRTYLSKRTATADKPFLFTWSGLPNVYLAGIQYEECQRCHKVAGRFPAPLRLLDVLTKAVAEKPSPLTGLEIRYLRKSLGKKAIDFATLIGVSPEQVSRWENGHNSPEKSADKLIRLLATRRVDSEELNTLANVCHTSGKQSYLLQFQKKKWRVAA